jgi:tetratricopeptide (TPR) repeat protein
MWEHQRSARGKDSISLQTFLETVLEFCPKLVIILTIPISANISKAPSAVIRLGPLDAADTREYMKAHDDHAVRLASAAEYDRVSRATGGLPGYLDRLVESLNYTDLNSALSEFDTPTVDAHAHLPSSTVEKINSLLRDTDDFSNRTATLLSILSILEKGELLSVIKRIVPTAPIWGEHAKNLEDCGMLDVIDTASQNYDARRAVANSNEKVLRVPRVVRDYVLNQISDAEHMTLAKSAATLYFGADWRQGHVRMRRRPAFSPAVTAHRFSNEMRLLRYLLFQQRVNTKLTVENSLSLIISYVTYLQTKGFYGEAYEASCDFLGLILTDADLADRESEISELQTIGGKCARMIGEKTIAIDLLSKALSTVRGGSNKERVSDVLLSMALSYESLGNKHDAIKNSEEVIKLSPNVSANSIQAKAIIAGFTSDRKERLKKLRALSTRAANHRFYTVADNILLDLAEEAGDPEEALRHLATVRTRRDLEYNYVRATVRRIDTLIKAGRLSEINELDREDLGRCYAMAYSQRLTGIFNYCHRVIWKYLEEIGDIKARIGLACSPKAVPCDMRVIAARGGEETLDVNEGKTATQS